MIYGFILCLGDSITNGARDEYNRAYPFELSDMLSGEFDQQWVCINRGVNGWTSGNLLRNIYDLVKRYPEAAEVVICIGTNDARSDVRTPIDVFADNLRQILRVTRVFGKYVYLCTIPDLGGFGCLNYDSWSKSLINKYNEVVEVQSRQNGVFLVDLCGFPRECYADTVHINNTGAREMAQRVMATIIRRRGFGVKDITKKGSDGPDCNCYRYPTGNNQVQPGCSCARR